MNLEIIRDIFQIVFFATASTVACIGLWKWREELKGKVEYETAKQALAKAYSVRDQIRMIQSAIVFHSEWAGYESAEYETERQRKVNESFFAYSQRFQKLQDKVSELYPAMVEAEAVFGDEAREKLDELIAMTRRLWAAIVVYHQGLDQGRQNHQIAYRKFFNIINGINEFETPDMGTDEEPVDDDNFKRDLDAAMQEIKEYFSPRLGRNHPRL
jgi:hypothetical protein